MIEIRGRRASAPPHPLDDVETFLRRFVAYPSESACVGHVLWIAHAHLMDSWDSTPRIAFLSPEPGSGKSRALEASELLVPNPVEAINVTPAYMFRKVGAEEGRPTILYDEIDTVFGPKAKENEEIRGLLNAGHRRHGVAGRCVVRGKQVFTEEISAYCAVALAGLGGLPDTILSRSVIVRMRRRAPGEKVEAFRRRAEEARGHELRHRLAVWASGVADAVTGVWPAMPAGISDRDADVWEALLAVAGCSRWRVAEACSRSDCGACSGFQGEHAQPRGSAARRPEADLRRPSGDGDRRDHPGAVCPGRSAVVRSSWQAHRRPLARCTPRAIRRQVQERPYRRAHPEGLRAGRPP